MVEMLLELTRARARSPYVYRFRYISTSSSEFEVPNDFVRRWNALHGIWIPAWDEKQLILCSDWLCKFFFQTK